MRRIELGGIGPEDVVVDAAGRLLTGIADGRILRVTLDDGQVETLANTGGRPLGLEPLTDGRLIVCDAERGLLRVDPQGGGDVEVLVADIDGRPLRFCSNAAAAPDGTVYFSASSQRFGLEHYRGDLIEHSGTGRLFRRAPDGEVSVLLEGLQFANGVALSADGGYLVVAETGGYQLRRLWLTGPRAGTDDVLVANLPGFPDNISRGPSGLIWVALASPRNAQLDWLHRRQPILRRILWSMPESLQPRPLRTMWVVGVDDEGAIVRDLQATGAGFHFVTGVVEHAGRLYLGSLAGSAIAELALP